MHFVAELSIKEIVRRTGRDRNGQVIRERLVELGYAGGKTILDDYLREIRPIVSTPRTFQRTVRRPGQICQFDLWEPSSKVPVGAVEHRRG